MTQSSSSWLARCALALASTSALMVGAAHAGTDVGVSVSIGQPGFYGRVDIGNTQPVLVYPQPILIQPAPYAIQQRPIYMRVPPGHYKNWSRYCGQYNACGQRVYFIQDAAPRAYERGHDDDHRRYDDRRHYDDRRGDWDRHDRDEDRGPGRGHGKGRGHGHD